ncbi:sensor histidine kinase [Glycomyces albidus]|uniref:histidine kinase n=1 Tax=Glycomyces albidus TaxID=2656774 RepID=A0A6L5GC97_9ACTN|nr:ATP-binding protein [Glycomyces albidus]MQM27299.1 two-component sensor histidine kinase [Glycomyces albidus]
MNAPKAAMSGRFNRLLMRLLKFGLVSVLLVILLAEMLSHNSGEKPPMFSWLAWVQWATSMLAIAVYAWYRPGRKRWIAAVAVASLVVTGIDAVYDQVVRGVGTAELLAMGLLLLFAIRHWDAAPGRWVAFVLGAAILLIGGVRLFTYEGSDVGGTAMVVMAMLSVIGFGAYLRSMDKLRRETQEEVRRAERLELAREMHDFVAHHVTGMVVLAQAGQVTDTDPRKAFADIEEAGLAALASMRRMVRMLRADDTGGGVNPLGDLSQIEDLVDRFSREGTDATCFISPELAGGAVAPEIAATAHRVVREALTNVRKHARGATRVRVVVAAASGQGLEVSVRDDGRAPRGRFGRESLAQSGAGLGLVGLRERIEAVGGQLRAQERPEGGWETAAWLPREAAPVEV